jgi:hypothetical protein
MATISSPASFSSVRTAFNTEGYGISTSFFAYRRGGGIVPATSGFNAIGEGTVGSPLQLSQFNGFSVPSQAPPVNITNQVASDVKFSEPVTARYQLGNNGILYRTEGGTLIAISGEWLVSGSVTDYDALMETPTLTSGSGFYTLGGSAFDTWLNLSVTREWTVSLNSSDSSLATIVRIRNATTLQELDSAAITFDLIVEN